MRHLSDVPPTALLTSGLLGLLAGAAAGPVGGVVTAAVAVALAVFAPGRPVPLPVRVRRRGPTRRRG